MALASRSVRLSASLAASLALTGAAPSLALAHTLLENPPPLTDDDGAKEPPCGCVFGGTPACPATYNTMTVTAGEPLVVSWVETVNHPGSFTIKIVPSSVEEGTAGLLAVAPPIAEIDDTNETSGATITHTITVPNIECEGSCTLQLVQNMSDSGDEYYTCASINIVPPGGGAGGGGVGGAAGAGGGATTSTGSGNQGEGGAPVWEPEPLDSGCALGRVGASSLEARPLGVGLMASALAALGLAARRRRG